MSGYVGDLSSKQDEKLIKFKENLQEVLTPEHNDHLLLRFLRARSFDVHKSETLFRKDLEWRERQEIDQVKKTFKLPEVCQKYWPGGFVGYDKDGGPVWIEPTGMVDPKGLLQSCKTSDLLKYNICRMEGFITEINEQTKKLGKPIAGLTYIMDMHGLGRQHLWKPGIDLYNQINTILQNHYPESLKVILVIRAPKIFPLAYALCRPVLNSETRRKIHILGSDWRDVLLNYVNDDVLPVHWGGKATDPDGNPMSPSKICLGGEVPKSYYFQEVNIPEENMTERDIKRGSMLEFKYNVTKPGSFFRYAFKTKDHDISFGIKRIDSDGQKVKVLETTRVNSHFVLQDGQVELKTAGYYVFKFDNTFSWTKPKKIRYMLELLEPIDDLDEEKVLTTSFSDSLIENNQNIGESNDEKKNNENNTGMDNSDKEGVNDEKSVETEEDVKEEVNNEESVEKDAKEEGKDGQSVDKEESATQEVNDGTTESKEVESTNDGDDDVKDEGSAVKDASLTETADADVKEGIINVKSEEKSEDIKVDVSGENKEESLKEETKEVRSGDWMEISIKEDDEYIVIDSNSDK